MGVVDLAVVPTGRGPSLAEDPDSSLDVAGRADIEQGNRANASAEAASAIHPARAAHGHPTAADQPLPASASGGGDGGAAPGGADSGSDCRTLRLPPHHGGAAPQAGRGDAPHQPSRPCLPRAGAAGLQLGMVKHTTRLLGVSKDMVWNG